MIFDAAEAPLHQEHWPTLEEPRAATVDELKRAVPPKVLMKDDRGPCKLWLCDVNEAFLHLIDAVRRDTAVWTRMHGIDRSFAERWYWTIPFLGLPSSLHDKWKTCRVPTCWHLVKTKCWGDGCSHHCSKAGHSCWRRVIDCSGLPCPRGWRTLSRAARAIARLGRFPLEIWRLSYLRQGLEDMLQDLPSEDPSPCCLRCSSHLGGNLLYIHVM